MKHNIINNTIRKYGASRRHLVKLVEKYKLNKRKHYVLEQCGSVCFCPSCKDIMNDQAEWNGNDNGHGTYVCRCGNTSEWHFGIAPIPICLKANIHYENLIT